MKSKGYIKKINEFLDYQLARNEIIANLVYIMSMCDCCSCCNCDCCS